MSRASLSSNPRRGGTFRPNLEALEDRLAPGTLFRPPGLLLPIDPWSVAARQRETDELTALAASSASANAADETTSPVVEFFHRDVVRGESTLTRNDHGVTMHLTASDVPAGAYTAWWVIFNPGATGPIAGWATGLVVGEGENLTVATHLNEGELIGGAPLPGGSLQDARHATIWLVIRSHGPVDPGRIYEQTHTFEPGIGVDYLITMHAPPA